MPDHPLFERVHPSRRYTGKLEHLLAFLRKDAYRIAQAAGRRERIEDKDFAWVVLRGGAIVGLRVRGDMDMRKEIRIARERRPETPESKKKWNAEVGTFLKHFGITALDGDEPSDGTGWLWLDPHPNDERKGAAAARFLELRAGEIRPGEARCYGCLTDTGEIRKIPWFAGGGIEGQACQDHALRAGRARDADVQQKLELMP